MVVILVHSGLAFTCEYCQEEFGNEIKLSRHILKYHDVDKLQCEHCDFETLKQRSLDAHKAAKHRLGFNRREKVNVERRETSFSESQPSSMIVIVVSLILEEMLENAAVFVRRLPFDPAPFLPHDEDRVPGESTNPVEFFHSNLRNRRTNFNSDTLLLIFTNYIL